MSFLVNSYLGTVGGGGPTYSTTWNSADKAAQIVLSGGNLTAARPSGSGDTWQGVRATQGFTSGKRYFEITATTVPTTGGLLVGLANSSWALNGNTSGSHVIAMYAADGNIYQNAVDVGDAGIIGTAGDVMGVAADFDADTVQFRKNGGTLSATCSISMIAGTIFPIVGFTNNNPESITANFGTSSFSGGLPSGFVAWNT